MNTRTPPEHLVTGTTVICEHSGRLAFAMGYNLLLESGGKYIISGATLEKTGNPVLSGFGARLFSTLCRSPFVKDGTFGDIEIETCWVTLATPLKAGDDGFGTFLVLLRKALQTQVLVLTLARQDRPDPAHQQVHAWMFHAARQDPSLAVAYAEPGYPAFQRRGSSS